MVTSPGDGGGTPGDKFFHRSRSPSSFRIVSFDEPGGDAWRERYGFNVRMQGRFHAANFSVNRNAAPHSGRPGTRCLSGPADPRGSHPVTGTKPNLPNPGGQTPCIDGMVEVPRLVLIDMETGTRVRHRIRSIKQALKQQEWYETVLGRHVRIEKVFDR